MTRYSTSRPVQSCAASAAPVRGLLARRFDVPRLQTNRLTRAARSKTCMRRGVADSTDVNCPASSLRPFLRGRLVSVCSAASARSGGGRGGGPARHERAARPSNLPPQFLS